VNSDKNQRSVEHTANTGGVPPENIVSLPANKLAELDDGLQLVLSYSIGDAE